MRICVLLGSLRAASNTARVVGLLGAALSAAGAAVDVVDPRTMSLRVPGAAGQDEDNAKVAAALKERVAASQLVILATPEYDGSYSAVLKILIEHLGYPSVLAGKPVALLGVASGAIGAIKALEHLRGLCVHIGALVMPEAKSLAAAHKLFDDGGACTDAAMVADCTAFAAAVLGFGRWALGKAR